MKATAQAPANIAFIKYWGKKDSKLRLPYNSSISMNLSEAYTTTTVEFSPKYNKDEIYFDSQRMESAEAERVLRQLDRLRNIARSKLFVKVATTNSFPKSAGIASSASGFAALTLAAARALGLKLSEKELSILTRIGSGSAARSIPDGFVQWQDGIDNDSSYAYSLYNPNYWDLLDIIIIVNQSKKKVSSTQGHENAQSSPFFQARLKNLPKRIKMLKDSLKNKDFAKFGKLVEEEAIELHTIMMTQKPPLFYWIGVTMDIIHSVLKWREEGIPVYFTIDAGPNVHLICEGKDKQGVLEKIKQIKEVDEIIINKPNQGVRLISSHLF